MSSIAIASSTPSNSLQQYLSTRQTDRAPPNGRISVTA